MVSCGQELNSHREFIVMVAKGVKVQGSGGGIRGERDLGNKGSIGKFAWSNSNGEFVQGSLIHTQFDIFEGQSIIESVFWRYIIMSPACGWKSRTERHLEDWLCWESISRLLQRWTIIDIIMRKVKLRSLRDRGRYEKRLLTRASEVASWSVSHVRISTSTSSTRMISKTLKDYIN